MRRISVREAHLRGMGRRMAPHKVPPSFIWQAAGQLCVAWALVPGLPGYAQSDGVTHQEKNSATCNLVNCTRARKKWAPARKTGLAAVRAADHG